MTKLTPEQLRIKYGMDDPPKIDHPIIGAIHAGEQLVAQMFNWPVGTDVHQLWDPSQCPEMYKIATEAHRDLRLAINQGDVEYVSVDGEPVGRTYVLDAGALVSFVGSSDVIVVGGERDADRFVAKYKDTWQPSIRRADPARCSVKIAPKCYARVNGRVEYWPYLCSEFLLMFAICPACRDRAIQMAEDGAKLGVMAAHELRAEAPLPPWARTAPWYLRAWAAVRRAFRRAR